MKLDSETFADDEAVTQREPELGCALFLFPQGKGVMWTSISIFVSARE